MADSTVPVEIAQFAEVLNGFTSLPTARLTALLEGAVRYSSDIASTSLFCDLNVPNTYDLLHRWIASDTASASAAEGKLRDFAVLEIGHIASTATDGLYKKAFTKCGVLDLDAWSASARDVGGSLTAVCIAELPLPSASNNGASASAASNVGELFATPAFQNNIDRAIRNGFMFHALYPMGCVNALPLKLLFLTLDRLTPSSSTLVEDATAAIKDTRYERAVGDWQSYDWLAGVCDRFKYSANSAEGETGGKFDNAFADLRPYVVSASAEVHRTAKKSDDWSVEMNGEYGPMFTAPSTIETICTGERLHTWMNCVSDSPRIESVPINHEYMHHNGCVLAGTAIVLASGDAAPIEEIAPGTHVLASDGSVSITSDELVDNPHVRYLYAINDDEPFMSLDHAILTQDGFKCPDPEAALRIDPDAPVSLLRVGDVVNKSELLQDGTLSYSLEVVSRINIVSVGDAMCYDLHFREGQRSYHANGYICYLNYPQITAASLRARLKDAQGVESAHTALDEIASNRAVRAALGASMASQFDSLARDSRSRLSVAREPHVECDRPNLRFNFVSWDGPGQGADAGGASIPFFGLALHGGRLFAARHDADGPCELNVERQGRTFYFSANPERDVNGPAAYGRQLEGAFKVVYHGLLARGIVRQGDVIRSFTAGVCDEYELKRDGSAFGMVRVETTPSANMDAFVPRGRLFLFDADGPDFDPIEMSGCTVSVGMRSYTPQGGAARQRLSIDIAVPTAYSALLASSDVFLPERINLVFDEMALNAVEDPEGGETHGITAEMAFVWSEENCLLAPAYLDRAIRANDTSRPPVAPSLYKPRRILSADAKKELSLAIPRSVEELYGLPLPESFAAIHRFSWSCMLTMSLYVAKDEQLEALCVSRPTVGGGAISPQMAALANAHEEFLRDIYLAGYICSAFSEFDDDYIQAIYDGIGRSREKLRYFFNGDDCEEVLGGSKECAEILSELNNMAYLSCVPELASYVDGASDLWCEELLAYASDETNVGNIGGLLAADGPEMGRARHVANMMDVLDYASVKRAGRHSDSTQQLGERPRQYLSAVACWQIRGIALSAFDLSCADMPEGVGEQVALLVVSKLVDAAVNGGDFFGIPLDADVAWEIRAELQNSNASPDLREFANSVAGLIWGLFLELRINDGELYRRVVDHGTTATYSMSALMMVISFIQMGTGDWTGDVASIASLAASVIETMAFCTEVFLVARIAKAVANRSLSLAELLGREMRITFSGDVALLLPGGGGELAFLSRQTNWINAYKIARPLVKAAGVVTASVCLGVTVKDLVDAAKAGYTTGIVCQSVNLIFNAVSTGFVMAEVAGCACPIAGVVLAACAIICFMCDLILMADPPHVPSPQERYLSGDGAVFMKALPMPTEEFEKLIKEVDASGAV